MVEAEGLRELIDHHGWLDTSTSILTREGKTFDASGDAWALPHSIRDNSTLEFGNITNAKLRWVTKAYVRDRIERVSTHAGYALFHDVWREFLEAVWQNDFY